MATRLDPKQIVSFEEFLMSQVVQQEVLPRLLVEKGIFSKEKFLEMVRVVDSEMKRKGGGRLNWRLMNTGRGLKRKQRGDPV